MIMMAHAELLKPHVMAAAMGINLKLNAQVMIRNLRNMHEKSLPPTGARRRMELEYWDWARLHGRGPLAHTGGHNDRLVGWPGRTRMWYSLKEGRRPDNFEDPPVDST